MLRIALFAVICSLACGSASAWTAATRIRITDEAIRFMPPSLRLALERHREDVLRGMLAPLTGEDGPSHRPSNWDGGTLESEIEARMNAVVAAAAKPKSFREVAKAFGALAHFVSDAGFPPGASGRAGVSHYADYGAFCESRTAKFRLVFYGHEDLKTLGGARGFAAAVLAEAQSADAELARAYAAAGSSPDPAAFDDRSVPFAVGALSYSKTITNVVRAWLAAWGRAEGDLARTPYLESTGTYRR